MADSLDPVASIAEVSNKSSRPGEIWAQSLSNLIQVLPRDVDPNDSANVIVVLKILIQEFAKSGNEDQFKEILTWAFYARRPLLLTELQHAIAFLHPPENSLVDPISLCAGLITTDSSGESAVFSHEIVRKVLLQGCKTFLRSEASVAKICLSYLCQEGLPSTPSESIEELQKRLGDWGLLAYSASFWGDHVKRCWADKSNELCAMVDSLLSDTGRLAAATEILYLVRSPRKAAKPVSPENVVALPKKTYPDKFGPLHWLACFNLDELLQRYLQMSGYDALSRDGWGRTPLHMAVIENKLSTARLLMSPRLDVDKYTDDSKRTPLHYAAENGSLEMVKLLTIENSWGSTAKDVNGLTPIQLASRYGRQDVLDYFLGQEEFSSDSLGNALCAAASGGKIEIMETLLSRGIFPNENAVNAAISSGIEDSLHILMQYGADIKSRPLLHLAVISGSSDMVQFLLQTGVDINESEGVDEMTPLHHAARKGDLVITKKLLRYCADLDAVDKAGRTPLFFAVDGGHKATTWELIINGAELNDRDNMGNTPISVALANSNTDIIAMLVRTGATIDESKISL